jgi:hypothetical protein
MMTRPDALRLLEETLEMPPHSLTGGEALRELQNWDSMSALAFIAMVDERLGRPLPGGLVARCRSVDDLLGLLGVAGAERAA